MLEKPKHHWDVIKPLVFMFLSDYEKKKLILILMRINSALVEICCVQAVIYMSQLISKMLFGTKFNLWKNI